MKKYIYFGALHFSLLSYFVYKEYTKSHRLYTTLVSLTKNNALHLFHTLFLMYIIFVLSKILVKYTLDTIRSDEISTVNDNCFIFLTDILLIVTIFSDDLCIKNLIIFTILLSLKCLNWVTIERIKHSQNSKILILLFTSGLISFLLSFGSISSALKKPSLYILFGFEFAIIFLSANRNLIHFIVHVKESPNKTIQIFLIDILYIALRLVCVVLFFAYTAINFRLPYNLFREALSTIRALVKKTNGFIAYRRISAELDRCSDVSADTQCPICFCDMETGKKITCGHVFHVECLRKWVESSQACPICRRALFASTDVTFTTETETITGTPVVYSE